MDRKPPGGEERLGQPATNLGNPLPPLSQKSPSGPKRQALRQLLVYIFLALPVAALLWPGLYAFAEPSIAGVPFFYWYQLLWVVLGSVSIGLAYGIESRAIERRHDG